MKRSESDSRRVAEIEEGGDPASSEDYAGTSKPLSFGIQEPGERWFVTGTGRRAPYEEPKPANLRERMAYPITLPRFLRPPLGKAFRRVAGMVPERVRTSRPARLVARHPGLSAWAVACAGVAAVIINFHISPPGLYDARYQKWMRLRGTEAVSAALAEIGPGLEEPTVQARPMKAFVAGSYRPQSHTITFSSSGEFFDFELLDTAAHESVHAIFFQNGLHPPSKYEDDFCWLVNETTAYVLGAYIAGDAWTKQGYDGKTLSAYLVQSYRNTCDPTVEDSLYNKYLAPGRPGSGEFDRDRWRSVLIHFGPVELVDAIDLIACQNPDPTTACRKVAERFMREDLSLVDQKIFEEFERTRARWAHERP